MQLHKSLLADALCAEDRAPATFLTYFFIFQNQTWCPRQHSPPIQTPLWQRVSTLVVLFKPLLWMFNSASNSWVPAKESILILQPFIVCAVSWTHGHACVLCSASDSGLLTSHPTRADTTMIQGNSYTFCFIFYVAGTQTGFCLDSHSCETRHSSLPLRSCTFEQSHDLSLPRLLPDTSSLKLLVLFFFPSVVTTAAPESIDSTIITGNSRSLSWKP